MEWHELARRQHGVLGAQQAALAGLTSSEVRWRLTSGRWQSLGRGLYLTHSGEVSWIQRAQASVLRAGRGGVLTGISAAYLHGLLAQPPTRVTLAIPRSRRVVPLPWMDAYGWRPFTETEKVASANYYRRLGGHMNIKSVPETYQEFSVLADAYEREHFAFDEGGRAVAESTLRLLATFPPSHRLPAGLVRRACFALMDDPLLEAFGFPFPHPVLRSVVRTGLATRGRVVRYLPPRKTPRYARQLPNLRTYPHGYDITQLGTFPVDSNDDR